MHAQGIVHRDIKPSNIFLTNEGNVKLLDFGVAAINTEETVTGPAQILGSFDYMAPEQAINSAGVDSRADIYGLGCTLHHLLTGERPFADFARGNPIRVVVAHAQAKLKAVSETRSDIPPEFEQIVSAMCSKDPADRPATASRS